ncbi:hypothetical protein BT96DRAFT_976095 [Gymnopus androsaceus JB14]|uniref:Uncharacterized protein n=1 Tax=Gymnopus androsaceus JB14 TaxID=1447944 RepID=A0A6A4HQG8_9AGAR|nr:hypothetical protein BT96DRAFT_976095 [Gymnopus androsaceus JB14]
MMQTSLRQYASTSSRVLKRHSSTKSAAPHALSPEKMRALISLYHQSDTFITPENLSERIDKAFTGGARESALVTPAQQPGVDTLNTFYRQTKMAPKFSEWDREKRYFGVPQVNEDGTWSGPTYSKREWKVIEALYGVDASGKFEPMPGLEALEEGEDGEIGLPPAELVMENLEDEESHHRDELVGIQERNHSS